MPLTDNAYELVVGIANYQQLNRLPSTVLRDAHDVRDLLIDPQYCNYPSDNVRLLLDEQPTQVEDRLIIIGMSLQQRLLVVVHTDWDDTIRIISARRATAHERKTYERNAEQYG